MSAHTRPISVLCVDDDPDLVDLIATFLERTAGQLSVTTATSAREGIALLEGGAEIDCVVSDYDMPGMDGLAFLEAVRVDHPDLPFILFTGRGSEEVASDAISAGVTDYMQKEAGTEQYTILAQRIRNAVARSRAGTQATEAHQRARTILDASPDAIVVNVDGEHVYVNSAAVELFNADDEADLLGRSITECVHPDDRADVRDSIGSIRADERAVTRIRRTFRTLDGQSIPVEMTARNITWAGKNGVVTILRDVSARETAQRERSRYRAAFEKAFDAMVIADDEGRFIDANESATELFGLSMQELVGRHIADFAAEGFDFEAAWQHFQESDRERGTFPLVRATGERRTVEYAATPNIVPGEHLSVLRDVTDREEYERKLERRNERLDEFASIVSHDLRNPVTTIRGSVELAREGATPEHLDRIDHSLDRMERIIDDVLWLAREGRAIGATEAVDLEDAIEDAWKVVADEGTDANLVYENGSLGSLIADDDRLSQLLENVLRNAIEHGGPGVTVRVESLRDGFAIADDGPGIPPEERERVFDQGYSTAKEGTGFGLYIVEQVAEAHGWELAIAESETGGTRIEVTGVETPGGSN